jgi:type 1 glutamine amidotransferase
VPFEIVNPLKVPTGKNVIVLKGGMGYAKTQPKKVELSGLDIKADRLHFLGGIAGWGFPWGGADGHKDLPVAKVTVHFADQPDAEFVLKNGVEFADWIGADSVPGSASVPDLAKRGQVRWFTKVFPHPGEIKSVTLESYDNEVAPAFIAITAENGGGKAAPGPQAPVAPKELKWTPGFRRVLIVGGGSSHDFNRWFNQADSATLSAFDKTSVNYTENLDQALLSLKEADVLYLNSNQPMTNAALRQAIFDFANAGHGILLVHPALWYNWDNWPEYNRTLVGGGTHSHDKYGEFQVTVKEPSHPVMAKVPLTFKITDELYHSEIDPKGTPIEVLAEAKNDARDKIYPSVWIVKHPHARIVCIALGHDAQAHELAAYKTILQNSLNWVSGTK